MTAATDHRPLKVTKKTKALVRLGATLNDCTMGAFVDEAVREFLVAHRDEIEAGLADARVKLVLP